MNKDAYPGLELMFAIPNGGLRDKRVASQLKAEGVKAGVLDIFLPVPKIYVDKITGNQFAYCGLFIEMKYGTNKPSPEQEEFANAVVRQGYYVALCYSWQEAVEAIKNYYALEVKPQ
jgi:hypothetical protein